MNNNKIQTEEKYDAIMKKVIALAKSNPQLGSPELEELERLSAFIKAYDGEATAETSEASEVTDQRTFPPVKYSS